MVIQIKNQIRIASDRIRTICESCIFVENSCKITPTNSIKYQVGFRVPPPPSVLEGWPIVGWPNVGRSGRDKRFKDSSAGHS